MINIELVGELGRRFSSDIAGYREFVRGTGGPGEKNVVLNTKKTKMGW